MCNTTLAPPLRNKPQWPPCSTAYHMWCWNYDYTMTIHMSSIYTTATKEVPLPHPASVLWFRVPGLSPVNLGRYIFDVYRNGFRRCSGPSFGPNESSPLANVSWFGVGAHVRRSLYSFWVLSCGVNMPE